jgi:hypothetical protein
MTPKAQTDAPAGALRAKRARCQLQQRIDIGKRARSAAKPTRPKGEHP